MTKCPKCGAVGCNYQFGPRLTFIVTRDDGVEGEHFVDEKGECRIIWARD